MKRKILLSLLVSVYSWNCDAAYVPATVNSGFNHDVIANGQGNGSTPNQALQSITSAFDIPNNFTWLSADYQENSTTATYPNALPLSGTINSAATSGLTFQLGDYNLPNTLLLSASNTNGSLNLSNAANVAEVHLLTAAANGAVTFSATVHFSDQSTQSFNTLSAKDWFHQTGFAINNLYRVSTSTGTVNVVNGNPRLYGVKLTLSAANVGKTITDIDFIATIGTTSNSTMGIFAVSTTTACTTPTAATITGPASACSGSSVTYTATNPAANTGTGVTYEWQTSSPGANTWTTVPNATGTTYKTTITSAIDIQYIAICNASSMSTPSNVLAVTVDPTCYCSPSYSSACNSGNKIRTVVIDTYSDPTASSVCNQSSVPTVSLATNTTPSVTVTTGAFVGVSASIDVGVDGRLDDAGDIFYPMTYVASGSATYTFNLPNISTAGTYRLRIWCAGGNSGSGSSTNAQPCDQYNFGNYRDYDLVYSHPLSITLGRIEARNLGASNLITWEVTKAENNDRMELQRSKNNREFETLAAINALPGQNYYSHRDERPFSGTGYYRLKWINDDGTITYSKTVSALAKITGEVTVSPNPAKNYLDVQGLDTDVLEAQVLNSLGQILKKENIINDKIDISQLPKGVYYLRLLSDDSVQMVKFVKE